jgi:hypothetical protein
MRDPTQEYLELDYSEVEEMRWDDDYHCLLSKSDLERIRKLPENITLALPFLHTQDEVEVHKIMNWFFRSLDEKYFRKRDFDSEAKAPEKNLEEEEEDFTTRDYGNCSETVHEVAVEEQERERLRTMTVLDYTLESGLPALSSEEIAWLRMDKILSPHVYHPDERGPIENFVFNTGHKPRVRDVKFFERNKNKGARKKRKKKNALEEEARRPFLCPYDRTHLLYIMEEEEEDVQEGDEHMSRVLMDHFFVPDEDTLVGHDEVFHLRNVCREVQATITTLDEEYRNTMREIAKGSPAYDPRLGDGMLIKRCWGGEDTVHPAGSEV